MFNELAKLFWLIIGFLNLLWLSEDLTQHFPKFSGEIGNGKWVVYSIMAMVYLCTTTGSKQNNKN